MIDEADEDGSGSINFPEFIGLMMKKQQGGQTKDDIKQVRLRDETRQSKDVTKHATVQDGNYCALAKKSGIEKRDAPKNLRGSLLLCILASLTERARLPSFARLL